MVLLLNFIPIPRLSIDYSDIFHESFESVSVGLGFPFSYFKLYLGYGADGGSFDYSFPKSLLSGGFIHPGSIRILPLGIIFNILLLIIVLPLVWSVLYNLKADIPKIKSFIRENSNFRKIRFLYNLFIIVFVVFFIIMAFLGQECKFTSFKADCYRFVAVIKQDISFCSKDADAEIEEIGQDFFGKYPNDPLYSDRIKSSAYSECVYDVGRDWRR